MTTALDAHALDEAAGSGDFARLAHLLTSRSPWSTQALDDALASALEAGYPMAADQLVAHGAQPSTLGMDTWQRALDDPRLLTLRWLVARSDARLQDSLPLRLAMAQGRWEAATLLLPVSQAQAQGSEAMRHGLERGAPVALLQALLDQGAEVAQVGAAGERADPSTVAWLLGVLPQVQVIDAFRQARQWRALDQALLGVPPDLLQRELSRGGPLPQAHVRARAEARQAALAERPAGGGRPRSRS